MQLRECKKINGLKQKKGKLGETVSGLPLIINIWEGKKCVG
jgi:hypothetical protein